MHKTVQKIKPDKSFLLCRCPGCKKPDYFLYINTPLVSHLIMNATQRFNIWPAVLLSSLIQIRIKILLLLFPLSRKKSCHYTLLIHKCLPSPTWWDFTHFMLSNGKFLEYTNRSKKSYSHWFGWVNCLYKDNEAHDDFLIMCFRISE